MSGVYEQDFTEVELRVLAHMREDAEKMDDTDSFRRPEDLSGFDTQKVRTLLSLQDAKKILKGEGCQTVDVHKKKAAEMFDIPESEVTPEQRAFAKSYNYMDMYSAGSGFIDKLVTVALENARKSIG